MYLCETENMLTLHCEGNKQGICVGKTVFIPRYSRSFRILSQDSSEIVELSAREREADLYRYAREKTKTEREALYRRLKQDCESAWVFLMHAVLLDDALFSELPLLSISEGKRAEDAVLNSLIHFEDRLCHSFGKNELHVLIPDVIDVCRSLVSEISSQRKRSKVRKTEQESENNIVLDGDVLLCELPLPSFIVSNRRRIGGMVFSLALKSSSSYELASAFGIPTLVTEEELSDSLEGRRVIIDSDRGIFHLEPALNVLESYAELEEKKRSYEKKLAAISKENVTTSDGRTISLFADIRRSSDADAPLISFCDGIALHTWDELYLEKLCIPDEELLFENYRKAAEIMPTKPVIIQAFKSSGEVRLNSMISERDGERAGEVYVLYDASLRTQLRAAMRAAVYGRIRFAVSPNGSCSDISRCERIMEELSEELYDESREFAPIQIGAVIETPASAIVCGKLAGDADFFVVNTQKLLDLLDGDNDRNGNGYECAIKNEALTDLLSLIAESKNKNNKKTLISLSSPPDRTLLKKAIALGFDEFSISSAFLPQTKLMLSEI